MAPDKTVSYAASALAEARSQYAKRNPESERLLQEGGKYLPGGNTRTILHVSPFPLTFASGNGARLTSVDGHEYVDFLGEYSAGLFGHSNKRIRDAVAAAMDKGWNFGGQCTYEKVLAKKMVERFGASGLEQVRFTNSGTESNTMAIVAAIAATGRKKILVFSGGYHGGTLIFPMEYMKNPDVPTSNLPHDFVFAPYNNIAETKQVIASLPPASLAAILLEPIQGSGGCRPASRAFLHFVRQQASELGALLLVDEVMASRLGPNGYSATAGIRADMISYGKYIGGGMTFGAFGGRSDLMALFDPSRFLLQHPGTYNNNIVTMAAGVEALDIFDSQAVAALNARGARMKEALQDVLIRHGIYRQHPEGARRNIIEVDSFQGDTTIAGNDGNAASQEALPKMFVTGEGSMLNVRFSGPDRAEWQALFYHHMLDNNIYLAARGYTPLNLALTDADVGNYVAAVESFVVAHKNTLTL
ncbi:hypothetical protein SEUCBS139899_003353 [Sporothrix eucalyptigena]|uniref:Glutamate-1-semialdehyde 2,1-aminomutase n=1 Tax=Sporothrix eucalyptigena TaxID=1812306 RepID=A0ABP0CAP0_9PEZI